MATDPPVGQPVPLGDAETAQRIAQAARSGRPADRRPRLAQLLAAFGETEATPQARARVAAALALAGVRTRPDVLDAAPGQRIVLEAGSAPRRVRPLLLGLAALALVVGGAVVAAAVVSVNSDKASDLPSGTPGGGAPGGVLTTATATTPTATATTPAATHTTTVGTLTTPRTTTTPKRPRARRRSPKAAPRKHRRSARVTVRFSPVQATYLCVEDGRGRVLFAGTLSSTRVVRARTVRMNVGLASTVVTVNGRRLALTGSPSGYEVTRTRRTPLPLGSRPEC
jgi:hypothetical protein